MATGSSALVSLGLLRERLPGERRVALTPADVKRLSAKAIVTVETGAGLEAGFPDDAYANAGAHLADLQQVLDGSAVIAKVRAPDASQTPRAGGVLISLGGRDAGLEKRLQERPVSHLALERVPRISRAQTMDVLSSQASVAGYVAVLDGEAGSFGTGGLQLSRGAPGRTAHYAVLRSVSGGERATHRNPLP
jgi:NAD(P) transhydrogenase subunit alpha